MASDYFCTLVPPLAQTHAKLYKLNPFMKLSYTQIAYLISDLLIYYVNITPNRHRENLCEVDPKQSESAPGLWREPQQASPP